MLDAHLETQPFLIRISAAKRVRDRAETAARNAGAARIDAACVAAALERVPA